MVETLFIPAIYTGTIELPETVVKLCQKYNQIGLFAAIQFAHACPAIEKKLAALGVGVIHSKSARASAEYQTLGCLVHYDNLRLEKRPKAFLYIGDGMFHPSALILSQKNQISLIPVIVYNPKTGEHIVLDEQYVSKIWKKYRGSLLKFLDAKSIGILVSTKFGQFQFALGESVAQKYPDKKFYYFVENSFSYSALTDFPFIDMWINTACPRIALDDAVYLEKPVINADDALIALELLSSDSLLTRV